MNIAIQGGQASFHHAAALQYFPGQELHLVECNLFSLVCDAVADGKADFGIMAIENTVAGSILPNYVLLQEGDLHVTGEIYLRIDQNLMALPGQKLQDIRIVRSHPMALLQCSEFLRAHPQMAPQESFDTADSAKEIRESHRLGVAAIAGRLAAELYGLEVLAPEIENQKTNYTRFLVLSREKFTPSSEANKATLSFTLKHQCGALVDVLLIFKELGCNLTLIQSVPLAGKPYEYLFCVDFEWEYKNVFDEALSRVQTAASDVNVIGVYKRGRL